MTKFTNTIGIILSLVTATGIFVHDARIDKVAKLSSDYVYRRNLVNSSDGSMVSEPHVHPERAQRTLNGFSYQSPSIQPRENKSKKYLMQNVEPRGRHAFDNFNLPIVS